MLQATERQHLMRISAILPPQRRSASTPFWKLAGFITGVLPALFGPQAVFVTVAAVETFVHAHYSEQMDKIARRSGYAALRQLLIDCQGGERKHREDAQRLLTGPQGFTLRLWCMVVGVNSVPGVWLAKRM
jgi:ubiquinone biosynthesis monooxygenase Coq7